MSSAKGSAMSCVTGKKIKGDLALWFEQAHGVAPFWGAQKKISVEGYFIASFLKLEKAIICQHIWHNI